MRISPYKKPFQIFNVSIRDFCDPDHKGPIELIKRKLLYFECGLEGWIRRDIGYYGRSLEKLQDQGVLQVGDLVQLAPLRLKEEFRISSAAIQKYEASLLKDHMYLGMNLGRHQTAMYRAGPRLRGWQY